MKNTLIILSYFLSKCFQTCISITSRMSGSQDSKVSSCLKDLPQRLQTPSLVVRKNIFHDLTDLITTTDLAENIIKVQLKISLMIPIFFIVSLLQGLCKVLSVTLLRYQDAQSRLLVLDLIKLMSSKHPSVVSKAVHATILEVQQIFSHEIDSTIAKHLKLYNCKTP